MFLCDLYTGHIKFPSKKFYVHHFCNPYCSTDDNDDGWAAF